MELELTGFAGVWERDADRLLLPRRSKEAEAGPVAGLLSFDAASFTSMRACAYEPYVEEVGRMPDRFIVSYKSCASY
jgi:hypothetical protein